MELPFHLPFYPFSCSPLILRSRILPSPPKPTSSTISNPFNALAKDLMLDVCDLVIDAAFVGAFFLMKINEFALGI